MKAPLLALLVCIPLGCITCTLGAENDIRWGEPVDGLRIGIQNPPTTATSDEEMKFTIVAENVSQKPIILPALTTFVHKSHAQAKEFYGLPLAPILENEKNGAVYDPLSGIVQCMTEGISVDETKEDVIQIVPGKTLVWESIPLKSSCYFADRLPGNRKTSLEIWNLLPGHHIHIHFSFENLSKVVAGKTVWTGKAESAVADIDVKSPSMEGLKIEGGFTLPKTTYYLGEPMVATFTVKNNSAFAVEFPTGGDYRGSGRHDRFYFRAVDDQGNSVPDPLPSSSYMMGGGMGSDRTLKAGEDYSEKILVNLWCAFPKSGKYKVNCKRTLNLSKQDASTPQFYYMPEESRLSYPIQTSLEVTLVDDPGALAAADKQAMEKTDFDATEWLQSLAWARNEAAFPEFVKLLGTWKSPSYPSYTVRWLACYGKEKATPIFLQKADTLVPVDRVAALEKLNEWGVPEVEPHLIVALHDTDHEVRAQAVLICSRKKYSSCTPVLLTMGNDPDPLVKRYLGAALGKCGDEKAIPVLLQLLKDSDIDPYITIWAADGLTQFQRKDGVPVLIALLHDPKDSQGNILDTLRNITGKKFDSSRAWLDWWEKEGRAEYEKSSPAK